LDEKKYTHQFTFISDILILPFIGNLHIVTYNILQMLPDYYLQITFIIFLSS